MRKFLKRSQESGVRSQNLVAKGFGFFAVLILILVFCLLSPVTAAPSGDQLLQQMTVAEENIAYSGVQIIQRAGREREVAKIWRDGHKKRLEWLEPAVKKGDILVDDERSVWLFHRAENAAIQTKTPSHSHSAPSGVTKVEATNIAGRSAWQISLKDGRKIAVDANNKTSLRMQSGEFVIALQSVSFGSVAASQFQFSPPTGAEVTRSNGTLYAGLTPARRAASWLKAPSQLPAGYSLESAVVDPAGEVWLRYTNGIRRFSLFQQKAGGDDLEPQKVDGGWFWKSGGVRFLTTGVSGATAKAMAASLK